MTAVFNENFNQKAEKIRRVFGICLGAWTVLVGVLFILQTWRIFLGGEGFTVSSVSAKFNEILLPFIIWVLAVCVGGAFAVAFPIYEKTVPLVDPRSSLKKLKARLPQKDEGRYAFNVRFVAWSIFVVIALVCVVVAILYLTNAAYEPLANAGFFAEHVEAERIVRALIWVFAAFGVAIAVALFDHYSVRKEIALVKTEIAENAKKGVTVKAVQFLKSVKSVKSTKGEKQARTSEKIKLALRVAVGVAAIGLIVSGVINGGMADVLGKAINICTQCIGLG